MRSIIKTSLSFSAAAGAVCSIAAAHPGHGHPDRERPKPPSTLSQATSEPSAARRWKSADGGVQEEGTFVMARDGRVQIRRADDSLVLLPVAVLSRDDQEWIARRLAAIRGSFSLPSALLLGAEVDGDEFDSLGGVGFDAASGTSSVDPLTVLLFRLRGDRSKAPLLLAMQSKPQAEGSAARRPSPEIAAAFAAFVDKKAIRTRWDDRWFYVESNGLPDHTMMVGITAWQQQVPLPQKYLGENAWRIPLAPTPAKNPLSTKDRFLRGAIAVAANGVPIFNPLNNRGDDAFLFGELDEFGGHCGRADDYHYHIAPIHLEKAVGKGKPIAYALDGYPIYGYEEPDGTPVKNLDAFNGHAGPDGRYHYHASPRYPYLNGGFHGEVVEREGQVDPQPRAEPLRPALPPLRDAKIVDFVAKESGGGKLTYDVRGRTGTVEFALAADGSATFTYVDPQGKSTTETYSARRRGPGGERRPPPRPGDAPPSRAGGGEKPPPPLDGRPPAPRNASPDGDAGDRRAPADAPSERPKLSVSSASVDAAGFLSIDCTCDGAGLSPAVAWKDPPAGTKSFAVSLWHTAPDQEKSYWIVYDLPADCRGLAKNSSGRGSVGLNDRRKAAYDPMCSKGPGVKKYHLTVYALSAAPKLSPDKATRAGLLAAVEGVVLAEGTVEFLYERKEVK